MNTCFFKFSFAQYFHLMILFFKPGRSTFQNRRSTACRLSSLGILHASMQHYTRMRVMPHPAYRINYGDFRSDPSCCGRLDTSTLMRNAYGLYRYRVGVSTIYEESKTVPGNIRFIPLHTKFRTGNADKLLGNGQF